MAKTYTKKELTNKLDTALKESRSNFIKDYNVPWDYGMNWPAVDPDLFETYINNYLFPKCNESWLINIKLGNTFNWLAKEKEWIGQFSEEYVFMDTVPVSMNLTKDAVLMLKKNYPRIATKFYHEGVQKKQKFTLNDNEARLKWITLGDGVAFAIGKLKHEISMINLNEEKEMKAMLVDYSFNIKNPRIVTSLQELCDETFTAFLDIQDNSEEYNETVDASDGAIGRRTTVTNIDDVIILTTNRVKRYILDTKLANTFQVAGLDPTKKVISFKDLGGAWRCTADFTITQQAVDYMRTFGDYQVAVGDIIHKNDVFTYDLAPITGIEFEEIKPDSDLFSYIIDVNKIRYNRYTKNMLSSFVNNEFDETNHWLKYYTEKRMSPFYNSILIKGE